MKIMWLVMTLLLGLSVGYLFASEKQNVQVPERPANVPERAAWAGGSDGGAWAACSKAGDQLMSCTVYANGTGAIIETGYFSFDPGEFRPYFYTAGEIRLGSAVLRRVASKELEEAVTSR